MQASARQDIPPSVRNTEGAFRRSQRQLQQNVELLVNSTFCEVSSPADERGASRRGASPGSLP
jgi:hypothetical protein